MEPDEDCEFQCPILGPVAFSPSETNLNRTADPQCGHFARTVSSSTGSYWLGFNHMSWKHLGQLRTCVAIDFLVHWDRQDVHDIHREPTLV
jgi:hypothetical protein